MRGTTSGLTARAELRAGRVHAASGAARAADLAYHASGATSIRDESPLQRAFRDVHAAIQHAMVGPDVAELAGRVLIGVDADTSRL